jgi:hypothetical protein
MMMMMMVMIMMMISITFSFTILYKFLESSGKVKAIPVQAQRVPGD